MFQTCVLLPFEGYDELSVRLKPWPACRVVPGITWSPSRQAANGELYGIDRGPQADAYYADVVFFGEASDMETLADWLEQHGREPFCLSQIDGLIFPPNLDQVGSVPVAPVARDMENRVFWSHESGVNELHMTLRAVEPDFVESPPSSLDALVFSGVFTGDKSTSIGVQFSMSGKAVTVDLDQDAGVFHSAFTQGEAETAAALRYLMEMARANAFEMPAWTPYPFGKARGALPKNCKCREINISRASLNRWTLNLELVESFEVVP
jgi:hypothetical protein